MSVHATVCMAEAKVACAEDAHTSALAASIRASLRDRSTPAHVRRVDDAEDALREAKAELAAALFARSIVSAGRAA